ncbi:hypothetical protein [Flavobacterium sp.]|uniref:hypothetical protein n=1 Tax=Flavobacterium sp. TaxID=239 RepID=UPI002FDCF0E6
MKTKMITLATLSLWSIVSSFAQDRTTVSAYNSEISDNLDLRAVASIFGDSRDLADFERRLNDPELQISNLDLNEDNKVDYLRVIETVEGNAHLIVIQSVLGRDTFQDVATVEVERGRNNRVQVQVVGNVYMYGPNYIYEPVYSFTPVIYTTFWINNYRPYYSSWYWGYYPAYYYAWTPYPIFRYRNHIGISINFHHHYNYVTYRRCHVAYNNYYRGGYRGNAYEVRYPNRSFGVRNSGYVNRYELDQRRNTRSVANGTRNYNTPRTAALTSTPRGNSGVRNYESPRTTTVQSTPRGNSGTRNYESPRAAVENSPRGNSGIRNYESPRVAVGSSPRGNSDTRSYSSPRGNSGTRSYESPRTAAAESTPIGNSGSRSYQSPRENAPRTSAAPRGNSSPREYSSQRGNSSRGENGSGGNRRS